MKTMVEKLNHSGKTVVVTGGYKGIGLGIVRNFADAGANIAICGRNRQAGEKVAEELRKEGVNIRFYEADVTDVQQIEDFAAQVIKDFGQIDVLVNNAGITDHTAVLDTTVDAYDRLFRTNVRGAYFMSAAVARHMIERRIPGKIVVVASMSAFVCNIPQRQATYNMSKAALVAMVKAMAVEWAEYGIRVNAVCPGYIETEMMVPELEKEWKRMTPIGYFGTPDDVGNEVLFLASDASRYMTGASVVMDGGYTSI